MSTSSLQNDTYWLLAQMANKVRHEFSRLADAHGISAAQLHALCLLGPDVPVPMNRISCQLGCDASYVTGIIDRLESHGYLHRKDAPNDRRIKMIVLTAQGAALRATILKDIATQDGTLLQSLTGQECRQLQNLIAKVVAS